MKRKNGENIITSSDITVLGKKLTDKYGKTLEDVLEKMSETLESLKSNVKWLYKYGGVGGKGGGGGSDSSTFSDKWYASIQINSLSATEPIYVPLVDSSTTEYLNVMIKDAYSVSILIYLPYGLEFKANIKYAGRTVPGGSGILFNRTEDYIKECPITINNNGTLEVQISDTAAVSDPKIYKINCIVNAYSFEENILYDDRTIIVKNTRNTYLSYMSDILQRGNINYLLIATTYYKFPIRVEWTTIDGVPHECTFNQDSAFLYNNEDLFDGGIPILDDTGFFILNGEALYDKAGTYVFNVKKYIVSTKGDQLIEDSNFMIDVIPKELYLSILPRSNFIIYLNNNIEDAAVTYKGTKEFAITPYMGLTSDGSLVAVRIKVNNEIYGDVYSIEVRRTANPVIYFTLPEGETVAWIRIDFEVCPDKLFLESNTKRFTRYIKIKEYDLTIDWYEGKLQAGLGAHYRFGEDSGNNGFKYTSNNQNLVGSSRIIRSNNNDDSIEIKSDALVGLSSDQVYECMINIGIQYNDINNIDRPILKITGSGGKVGFDDQASDGDFLIYLNSIYYNGSAIGYVKTANDEGGPGVISGFFINKEVDYKTYDNSKYLLLTITRRYIKQTNENGVANQYEISVYINGVLLTCYSSFIDSTLPYCKFILNNCNYCINLLDILHFNNGYLNDAVVVRYWYAYNSKILNNNENIETKLSLLNTFSNEFNYNSLSSLNLKVLGRVKVSFNGFAALCRLKDFPILCVTYDSSAYNGESFMEFSERDDRKADEDPDIGEDPDNPVGSDVVDVKVWWKGKDESVLISKQEDIVNINTNIGSPDGNINGLFKLIILGSTTRTYKGKNYTLKLCGKSQSLTGYYIPIFTPNFDPVTTNDSNELKEYKWKHNFLPESEFTLKADVVDSSHTNNTCMGSFINDVSTKFNLAQLSGRYSAYIKNCLQGFPFLMFVYDSKEENEEGTQGQYYYLGIYNFNLGRKSYFNLGYTNVGLLDEIDLENNMKSLYCVKKGDYQNLRNGFISAELLLNRDWFDFSLYDLSILFKIHDVDKEYMFGDIVPEHTDKVYTNEKVSISNFVKNISKAGGYIFKMLGKGFTSEDIEPISSPGYTVPHIVPQTTQQWEKYLQLNGEIGYRKLPKTIIQYDLDDLTNCINPHTNQLTGEEEEAYCDYTSLVEYYTICMAFGLLDNVLKNLTIKTWNNVGDPDDPNYGKATYHFAFYDMDTCLGINNIAGDVKYFAFSDSWDSNEVDTNTTISVVGEKENLHLYALNSIDILRDYTPGKGVDYFDIPSHYAFAIAKYTKTVLGDSRKISPLDLWAIWRSNQTLSGITETKLGCLKDAQTFLDNYYLKYMEGINELMFNYNYRAKYFKERPGSLSYNEELSRFHGNRHNYVKDWLTKRFHMLDAYFNLPKSDIPINDGDEIVNHGAQASFYESVYSNGQLNYEFNNDVQITKDIFTSSGTTFVASKDDDPSTWLIVKAPSYTPLMINLNQSVIGRYLLKDSSKFYRIIYTGGGGVSDRLKFYGSTLWTYLHNINFLNGDCSINSRYLENLVGNKGNVGVWNLTLPSLKIVSLTNNRGYSGTLTFNLNENLLGYKLFQDLKEVDISGTSISLVLHAGNIKKVNLNNITSNSINITDCPTITEVSCNNMTVTDTCQLETSWTRDFSLSGSNITNLIVSGKIEGGTTLGKLDIYEDLSMISLRASAYKEIEVKKCKKLTTFISQSSTTEKIKIETCESLKNVTIDVTSCSSLILNGCDLENIILYASCIEDFANLKTFLISGGTFENIHFRITNTSTDLDVSNTQGLLRLTLLTGITNFFIRSNPNIKYILFANNKDNPIITTSNKPLDGLENLERIYGNIRFGDGDHLFNNLFKFSLHGPTNNTGSLVINGTTYNKTKKVTINDRNYDIILTPLLLVSGETASQEEWDHNTIISHYDTIYNTGLGALWLSGEGVTNIGFTTTLGNNGSFAYVGYNSALTLFDVYYLFNVLALSKVNTNISLGSYAFWYNDAYPNDYRKFKYSEGNLFNRYMFYKCDKITSLGSFVFITDTDDALIYPPETDDQGNILYDNGLFSPLINLTSISYFCYRAYSNRFFLRRKTGNYTAFRTISEVRFSLMCDDINNYKVKPSLALNLNEDKYGSLKDLFKNTPNILTISVFDFTSGQLNYTDLVIPDTVNSIVYSFNCSYGKGTLNWNKLFDNTKTYSGLEEIVNSFNISGFVPGTYGVEFELHDMMFANMPSLKYIGYRCPWSGKHFDGGNTTNDYRGTRILTHNSMNYSFSVGFMGAGYAKKLKNGVFPYNILKNVGINTGDGSSKIGQIRSFGGLFSYLSSNTLIEDKIYFPSLMFEEAYELEDLSGLFMNSTIPIYLTTEGFKDCHYLFNVTRLFYIETDENSTSTGNIISPIPYRFFYLGEESNGVNYYYTTNDPNVDYTTINVLERLASLSPRKAKVSDIDDDDILSSIGLKRVSVNYKKYTSYIKFANECFSGLNKIVHYTWDESNATISNRNYIPVEHYINPDTSQWVTRPNNKKYTALYDISEIYDGDYTHLTNLGNNYYCKDSDNVIVNEDTNPGKTGGRNYICPPDIFNYFDNVSDVAVRGFFRWCGSSKLGHPEGDLDLVSRGTSDDNLSGRICPYMFDSISNVTSLIDFFEWCRGLSVYKIDGEKGNNLYMLPPTLFDNLKGLKNIARMVSGTYINNHPIVWPFSKLSGRSLDIRGLFACCDYSNETRVNMSGLFNGLTLNNISGVFCGYLVTLHGTTSYTQTLLELNQNYGQGIRLKRGFTLIQNVFKNSGNFSDNFSGATLSNLNLTKFLYYGYKASDNLVSEGSINTILNKNVLYNLGSV